MSEIKIYNLNKIFENYGKPTEFKLSLLLEKSICYVEMIYQSYNYILFVIKDGDETIYVNSIIIVTLDNDKVKTTFSYSPKNKILEIIYFDEEKLSLLAYVTEAISSNLVELKIFQIDLTKNEEKLIYKYTLNYYEESASSITYTPIHIRAVNNKYIMLITPNVIFYKNKVALLIDIENKKEIFIDPHITDNHYIYELVNMVNIRIKGKNYIFIKTGRFCSFEKRDFFYSKNKDYKDEIETILIIPCDELIQNLDKSADFKFSEYLVDKADYNASLDFSFDANVFYIPNYTYNKFSSILYNKENFIDKKTDIILYDLENKKYYHIGSLPFPLEKIPTIYSENDRYFVMYSPFYINRLGTFFDKYLIKHYLDTNEILFMELPITISKNELLNAVYFFKNDTIVETKNPDTKQNFIYSVNHDKLIANTSYGENYLPILNIKTGDLSSIIIYPRFLSKS
ncbi:hypothetical protein Calkr_1006 [Caldicellulosiruptor acetigenus I77R1B]|uniref:Uncharacterized protein n=1 Tax=Caldicellulosiruptor acetigenus (strain ATCC 700853 / DSM 12137 / I77R1B) TaxID=632335 RepID=E4S5J5_CALA7|nr:hypothetical protein [Caldicellulosiruptor acetigenus]ADQ40519.1 hypothetical protein Calkr_1006 [Caldicellulosiruptor acetigenus I77R1B]WAM35377.1 hypothetical protein OTK01_001714 [Caldicellulosiruptor acetigenus]